ncbi:WXG100 family type VII secretion target [Streptomyces sp. NPDC020983]|uniref:WXG100 family type VII secretion target n=1 Tax=Streptomyces sp. NPDC020983 TaxID=3365106 RepID=UPI003794D415
MTTGMKVTTASLGKLESDLDVMVGSMDRQVRALRAVIDNLEGHWRGIGANAFTAQQTLINEDHRVLALLLGRIGQAVHDTNLTAGATDEGVLQDMKSLDVNGAASGSGIAGL